MAERKTDAPVLIAQTGPQAGQRWTLAKEVFTLGRGAECDVVVADRQVSREHARIRRADGAYWVEDLESKNGTHVNGQRITAPQRLQDGDVIQIALAIKLIFVGSEATVPLIVDAPRPRGGRLRMDSLARRVWVGEREIDPPLSLQQYRLLEMLYENVGQVCSREAIVESVWPEVVEEGVSEQSIDALVRRLRDRLAEIDPEHQYVVTLRGHGFRMDNPPE
ncbi:MAG: FHA domain-containing protein [Chloroflexi bacterium]|nr:FHA domain-containing protein [Chloroflexota bacterium]